MDKSPEEPLRKKLIEYRGVYFVEEYKNYADAIENFQVRDDDVWIVGFPKTGTTWTREMVWCIANDLDFEGAKVNLEERSPYLEFEAVKDGNELLEKNPELSEPGYMKNRIEFTDNLPSPRFIKSHLPFHLLPRDLRERKTLAKIIYNTREPKDVAISFFNLIKNIRGGETTLEEFCTTFLNNQINYCPFWDHVLGFLNAKRQFGDQMMILKFSDMKADIRKVIGQVTKFIGKPSLSSDDLEKLVDHLSFEKVKENPAMNWKAYMDYQNQLYNHKREGEFMRSGQVGEWKKVMPQEISEKFDQRTSSALKFTDFNF